MRVTILHVEDCPNVEFASDRVRAAAATIGIDVTIEQVLLTSEAQASRHPFHGSPTIVVNGRDPFAAGGTSGALACRIYRNGDAVEGAPTTAEITRALREALS